MYIMLLQACSTGGVEVRPVPVEDRGIAAPDLDQRVSAGEPGRDGQREAGDDDSDQGSPSPAVVALLDQAQSSTDSGNMESAAASVERALRLQPKSALLWHRLAVVRYQQQQWQQALDLARKSNSLAAGDRTLKIDNWQLIVRIKEKVKDAAGAAHAREMVETITNY